MPSLEIPAQISRRRGYAWAALAVVTCPCHLLVLALRLSGTALGALIAHHLALALIVGVALFATFAMLAMRAFKVRP